MRQRATAEETYSRFLSNASVLDAAAHRFATQEDSVSALSTAWGADIYAAQAVVWERILVVSTSPHRQFFRVADALLAGLAETGATAAGPRSLRDVIARGREGVLADCDPDLQQGLTKAWADLAYLDGVAAPDDADLAAAVESRLGGLAPEDFVAQRRREAADGMSHAQALRIRGETFGAVQAAYDADFSGVEAYLVESAVAAGDHQLLSVTARWELVTHAVSALPGLPQGFLPAVGRIREAMAAALGGADGTRLSNALIPA